MPHQLIQPHTQRSRRQAITKVGAAIASSAREEPSNGPIDPGRVAVATGGAEQQGPQAAHHCPREQHGHGMKQDLGRRMILSGPSKEREQLDHRGHDQQGDESTQDSRADHRESQGKP
jgi:hypothetical protein